MNLLRHPNRASQKSHIHKHRKNPVTAPPKLTDTLNPESCPVPVRDEQHVYDMWPVDLFLQSNNSSGSAQNCTAGEPTAHLENGINQCWAVAASHGWIINLPKKNKQWIEQSRSSDGRSTKASGELNHHPAKPWMLKVAETFPRFKQNVLFARSILKSRMDCGDNKYPVIVMSGRASHHPVTGSNRSTDVN